MRVGLVVSGVVVSMLAFVYPLIYVWFLFLPVGIVLLALGAALKPSSGVGMPPGLAQNLTTRMYYVEMRQFHLEQRMAVLEGRPPVPPAAPAMPPPAVAPAIWAPPPPGPPLPGPPPSPAPAGPAAPPVAQAPGGLSHLELQLGEKGFQWIGIVILGIAFVFLLAVVLPRLEPLQIVLLDFAAAAGLVLLGEYIFARKGLKEWARGLQAGAFGIAYVGVWGGGFFFASNLPGFPWGATLVAVLAAHAAAAFRYRSPFLSVEVGLFFLAWITWLRLVGVLAAYDFAILLACGSLGILAVAYGLGDGRASTALMVSFGAVALSAPFPLAPYGYVPVLGFGLVATVFLNRVRLGRFAGLPPSFRFGIWVSGFALAYGVLLMNSLPLAPVRPADLTIASTFAVLTAAFTASEVLLKDDGRPFVFAALLGLLAFPVPILMARGESALVVYPAVLVALALLRPTKGLAWLPNLSYLGLLTIAGIAAVSLIGREGSFASLWALFFGLAGVHVFLQQRSGYATFDRWFPPDLLVPIVVVVLTGLTARTIPGPLPVDVYAAALPVAILLNRRALSEAPWRSALVVVAAGSAMALARWWALVFLVAGFASANGPLLAVYHVSVLAALGIWFAYRKSVQSFVLDPRFDPVRFSAPAFALFIGLLAQDLSESVVFAFLPIVVAGIAYYLDDAITFNAAYFLAGAEGIAATSIRLDVPADALLMAPVLAGVLVAVGFVHELWTGRRALAKFTQVSGTIAWFGAAPIAFGVEAETTVAWALAGGVAVAWGLGRKHAYLRYAGFALLFAALGKVFLYDIAGLDIGVRILALVVVAASLLVLSYGYARYRRRQAAAA
jgi:hypothetical protein